ncbi:hypothetical protein [Actinokineospora terrae]|uniref:Uncharacterized protein n=1 Tax=Actinokineospora terrae TaxID=155974 RepID=A0A1H9X7A3_9PSEU|nr:hypothetical protein [Actinokineospora terrae]SES42002.1 hypothetical protein SAMN04487818_11388 [Actinokineospora terrae]
MALPVASARETVRTLATMARKHPRDCVGVGLWTLAASLASVAVPILLG